MTKREERARARRQRHLMTLAFWAFNGCAMVGAGYMAALFMEALFKLAGV